MIKSKLALIIIIILFSIPSCSLFKQSKGEKRTRLLIAHTDFRHTDSVVNEGKIEAALNFIAIQTGKYELVPLHVRDSLSVQLKAAGEESTVYEIAKSTGADKNVFITISQLKNMLRVELIINTTEGFDARTGVGYCLLNYREIGNDKALYDPSLLKAIQRAFAAAVRDTNLFRQPDGSRTVMPTKTLAVGGLLFQTRPEILPKWELLNDKEVNSFDVVETIFSAAKDCPYYTVYDTETRDGIYSLFNLYIVENFVPPSPEEINALIKLEVDSYLTGSIRRIESGAFAELQLYDISTGKIRQIRSASDTIKTDDILDCRTVLQKLTKKVLDCR
ncbi:MAG: hypothetical protein HW421_2298 [Ignavibacteria bacterium]|nr:hypothetical protein [Ignavibacteria bacterium]